MAKAEMIRFMEMLLDDHGRLSPRRLVSLTSTPDSEIEASENAPVKADTSRHLSRALPDNV
jgi:hypothetical protein